MYRYLALVFTLAFPAAALGQTTPPSATAPATARMPRIRNNAEVAASLAAAYPAELRAAGSRGTVHVRMLVDTAGVPSELGVESGSGNARLDSAALGVAAVLRFYPATVDEKPVPLRATVPIRFAPEADSTSATPAAAASDCGAMLSAMGAASADRPPTLPPGVYGLDVEEYPALLNSAAVRNAMERNYPPEARTSKVGGTVQVSMIIDTAGVPTSLVVTRGSGDCALDAAGVRSVQSMRFRPARINGHPVPSAVDIPIQFMPR